MDKTSLYLWDRPQTSDIAHHETKVIKKKQFSAGVLWRDTGECGEREKHQHICVNHHTM